MINNYVRTPFYTQIEVTECGAVCLQIILAYYGCYCSIEELRERCGISRDGSNAEKLIDAAQFYGLEGEGYLAELPANQSMESNLLSLCDVPFPYIAFWEFNHFVVVEGIKNNQIMLNDPAMGRYNISYEEFSQKFTGVVLGFKKTTAFKKRGRYPRPWINLLEWVRLYPELIVMILIINAIIVLPLLIIPSLFQFNVDYILVKGNYDKIQPLIISLIIIHLIKILLSYFQTHLLNILQTKLAIDRQKKIIAHLFKLPMIFFDSRLAGDIMFQLGGVDRVSEFLSNQTLSAFINVFTFAAYFFCLLLISPSLTLIVFILTAIQLGLIFYSGNFIAQQSRNAVKYRGLFFGKLANGYGLIDTLKTQALENSLYQQLDSYHDQCLSIWQKLNQKMYFLNTLPSTLDLFGRMIILYLGAWYILNYNLSIGDLIAFMILAGYFQAPITQIVSVLTQLKTIESDIIRLHDVLDCKPRSKTKLPPGKSLNIKGKKLSARDLSFGFNRYDEPLLKNINFDLKRGQKIAIVGSLGSGKSTLIKCITGLYTLWDGEVSVDGIPIQNLQDIGKGAIIGVVSQQITLFQGTVRENLSLWENKYSDEEMINACRLAIIYEELVDRGGLDAIIAHGGNNFSGGQKQRLEIARILLNQPAFLILDEGTSALDYIIEDQIMNNLAELNMGLILIAHRMKSIENSDEIILLEKGRIIERGSHEQLLKLEKNYFKLVQKEENNEFDA